MRDILNIFDYLTESTGLANRKPGSVFRNPEGKEIIFNELNFFPEGGGKYDAAQMDHALKQVSAQGDIHWQNARSSRSGGFAIASFSSPEGEYLAGRYLENIKPVPTDNNIPNKIDDYRLASASAAKAQAGLSPQDLLTNKIDLTSTDILKQLETSLGTTNPLYAVAYRIASGEGLPMEFPAPADVSFTAFRDYFCEILQPMALQKGLYTGNAGEAAEIFLDGTFEDTTISFDTSKTAGLSDSVMTNPNGKSVKVSTKGGKGASASAKNLIDGINVLRRELVNAGAEIDRLKKENESLKTAKGE